jgi:hypothetical protein
MHAVERGLASTENASTYAVARVTSTDQMAQFRFDPRHRV